MRAFLYAMALSSTLISSGLAHGPGQVDEADAQWMMSLKQPDAPQVSCCGPSDHFYVDEYYQSKTDASGLIAFVVDKWIEVPGNKILWDKNNPTAHAVIFITSSGTVLCFVPQSST